MRIVVAGIRMVLQPFLLSTNYTNLHELWDVGSVAGPTTPLHHYLNIHRYYLHLKHLRSNHN